MSHYCLNLSGGETIRQINQQSGAHVELQRAPGPNPGEKLFNIRGNPGQIQHAIQLISEKAGLVRLRPYLQLTCLLCVARTSWVLPSFRESRNYKKTLLCASDNLLPTYI